MFGDRHAQRNFRWFSSLPLFIVTMALIFIAINALMGAQTGHAPMREALFDYYQRLKPAPATANSPIHVVLIDAESVDQIGPWPWPRTLLADLVDASVDAGARSVLVSVPLDEPDPLSPETIGEFWLKGAQDQALANQLALLPKTNDVLAQSLSRTPASVGVADDPSSALSALIRRRGDTQLAGDNLAFDNTTSRYLGLPSARVRYPLSSTLSASASPAAISLPVDRQGLLRRSHLVWTYDDRPVPSLGLEAARLALQAPSARITPQKTAVTEQGKIPTLITVGEKTLNLSTDGTFRHYPPRRTSVGTTAAWKLLDGSTSGTTVKDKVVLIGLSRDIGTSVRTPRGTFAPVMAHAMVGDQLINNISLKRPVWIGYLEAIAVMLLGAGAIMMAQRIQFWQAVAAAVVASIGLVLISAIAFMTNALLINPLLPALAIFVGIISVAGGKSVGTVLFDDNVRASFKGMLPESAMKALRSNKEKTLLDGAKRKVSILACELRITDEDLQSLEASPDDVARIIANASHNLRNTIVTMGGTVDQAEGGRLYAYFNAPLEVADHVEKACAAALGMIESMDRTNAELEASKRTRDIQVHLAIGITTGSCFVGPMGHGRSNRYSAIGPAMDMASLLRRQSEFYGPAIICDDHVYRDCNHKFAFLELDRLDTPYEQRPVNVHALIGNPFIKSSKSFRELDANHRAMIQAYRSGDAQAAREQLETIKKFPAAKIALFDIYDDRIADLQRKANVIGWDGVHQPAL